MADLELYQQWSIAARIDTKGGQRVTVSHDAVGALSVSTAYQQLIDTCEEIYPDCTVQQVKIIPPLPDEESEDD